MRKLWSDSAIEVGPEVVLASACKLDFIAIQAGVELSARPREPSVMVRWSRVVNRQDKRREHETW